MDHLNGWKEIARHLGRGVRTAQRWERELGLPVHRPRGKSRSAVIAFPQELDNWCHATPVRLDAYSEPAESREGQARSLLPGGITNVFPRRGQAKELVARAKELCAELTDLLSESRKRLHACMFAAARRGNSPTVLVVDDYAPHAYALERLLRKHGYCIVAVANGTEALELAAHVPDLILLDVGLPDVNGFEVCRRLKANPKTALIPVVFISATHQNPEAIVEGERCGASSFLFHPISPEELLPVMQASLVQAKAPQPIASAAPGVN